MNNKPLKSVHITNYYHKNSGGISTSFNNLLAAAERHRRLIRLIVPGETDAIEEINPYAKIYYVQAPQSPVFDKRYRILLPWKTYLKGDMPIRRILLDEMPDMIEIAEKYDISVMDKFKNAPNPPPLPPSSPVYNLIVEARNNGSAFAQYVACFLDVPVSILQTVENKMNLKDGGKFYRHRLTNLNQEYADEQFKSNFPLLRSMAMNWKIPLNAELENSLDENFSIKWKIYADNALPKEARIALKEIEIVDLRKTSVRS